MKKQMPLFWIILMLLVIAYPLFFFLYGISVPEDPDAFISISGEAVALILAILFALPYLFLLSITILVREILLFTKKKTKAWRISVASGISFLLLIVNVIAYLLL